MCDKVAIYPYIQTYLKRALYVADMSHCDIYTTDYSISCDKVYSDT